MSNHRTVSVRFPGGKRVDAAFGEMIVQTDQPPEYGGEGKAPSPFQLFLASIATCAGIFASEFCRSREISTEGMVLSMDFEFDPKTQERATVKMHLALPPGFPEKYKPAIIKAMDQCAVKKHIVNTPEFTVTAG